MIPPWLLLRKKYEREGNVCQPFTIRYGPFGKIALIFADFLNGIWSGFPICCVLAFTWDTIKYGHHPHARLRFLQCVYDEADFEHWLKQCGYVQCKACFEARYHIPKRMVREGGFCIKWLIDNPLLDELD